MEVHVDPSTLEPDSPAFTVHLNRSSGKAIYVVVTRLVDETADALRYAAELPFDQTQASLQVGSTLLRIGLIQAIFIKLYTLDLPNCYDETLDKEDCYALAGCVFKLAYDSLTTLAPLRKELIRRALDSMG